MCSTVRKTGDISVMFPPSWGKITMHNIPWFAYEAIVQGLAIISWYENFTEEELPPRYMWEDPELLNAHFDKIHEKRFPKDHKAGDVIPPDDKMEDNEMARAVKNLYA